VINLELEYIGAYLFLKKKGMLFFLFFQGDGQFPEPNGLFQGESDFLKP